MPGSSGLKQLGLTWLPLVCEELCLLLCRWWHNVTSLLRPPRQCQKMAVLATQNFVRFSHLKFKNVSLSGRFWGHSAKYPTWKCGNITQQRIYQQVQHMTLSWLMTWQPQLKMNKVLMENRKSMEAVWLVAMVMSRSLTMTSAHGCSKSCTDWKKKLIRNPRNGNNTGISCHTPLLRDLWGLVNFFSDWNPFLLEQFSIECCNSKTNIITLANHKRQWQSCYPVKTWSWSDTQEKICEWLTISFRFTSDWLRKCHKLFKPISKQMLQQSSENGD